MSNLTTESQQADAVEQLSPETKTKQALAMIAARTAALKAYPVGTETAQGKKHYRTHALRDEASAGIVFEMFAEQFNTQQIKGVRLTDLPMPQKERSFRWQLMRDIALTYPGMVLKVIAKSRPLGKKQQFDQDIIGIANDAYSSLQKVGVIVDNGVLRTSDGVPANVAIEQASVTTPPPAPVAPAAPPARWHQPEPETRPMVMDAALIGLTPPLARAVAKPSAAVEAPKPEAIDTKNLDIDLGDVRTPLTAMIEEITPSAAPANKVKGDGRALIERAVEAMQASQRGA